MKAIKRVPTRFPYHAAQLPVIGETGQARLSEARVHISGMGRVGTAVTLNLAASGVGYVSGNDPQAEEEENIGPSVFSHPADIGQPKIFALEKFLHGRPGFIFEPLVAAAESGEVDQLIKRCDLVVSCANTLQARLAAEHKAIRYRKAVMQVAACDGRECLGGLITFRLPRNRRSACFGCYLQSEQVFPRGEGLLSTTTATLAALASNMAVTLLSGMRTEFIRTHSIFFVDLETYNISALSVRRRRGCRVCGS